MSEICNYWLIYIKALKIQDKPLEAKTKGWVILRKWCSLNFVNWKNWIEITIEHQREEENPNGRCRQRCIFYWAVQAAEVCFSGCVWSVQGSQICAHITAHTAEINMPDVITIHPFSSSQPKLGWIGSRLNRVFLTYFSPATFSTYSGGNLRHSLSR